ncbi:flavodoxin family protein [Bordetella petrii]|uniref:flavodoxin family protein n=1 Tax=Bordetella petrii TaxID=94624 RepID=UPI001A965B00|nr:NAD(P)H-dependent oxidoreductase [Bordetella petrii]MBO1111972.1 NAD(P)H-dependent oxidoreductase [Bordetella petrii]
MKRLLIVWHSRTGAARQMARALVRGARQAGIALELADRLHVTLRRARLVEPADLLAADGYLFCAPENLAGLSGEMKECFDRCYYGALDRIEGRPYALAISAGTDGAGAARQAERICTGWRLRAAAPALIERNGAQTPQAILAPKTVPAAALRRCEELGGLLAATLLAGEE